MCKVIPSFKSGRYAISGGSVTVQDGPSTISMPTPLLSPRPGRWIAGRVTFCLSGEKMYRQKLIVSEMFRRDVGKYFRFCGALNGVQINPYNENVIVSVSQDRSLQE